MKFNKGSEVRVSADNGHLGSERRKYCERAGTVVDYDASDDKYVVIFDGQDYVKFYESELVPYRRKFTVGQGVRVKYDNSTWGTGCVTGFSGFDKTGPLYNVDLFDASVQGHVVTRVIREEWLKADTAPSNDKQFTVRPAKVPPVNSQSDDKTHAPAQQEAVNHPAHYGGDTVYEVIKVLRAWGLISNAYLWNTVKYIARAGKKDPAKYLQDLEKARFYLDREIAEERERQAR